MDFAARPSAFHVRYAPAVYSEGKGDLLPLRGGALLDVVLLTTSVDSKTGAPTHHPANSDELVNVAGWRTFRVDVAH